MIQWVVGETVGSYRLLRKLGAGGMGAVFLAEDTATGGQVALKTLLETGDAELVERFRREGRALAAVDGHPNVIRVHALHEGQGAIFLVMDAVSGGDLDERLKGGPLSVEEALHVVGEVARGLAHVHDRGILHRDIKPANVLFDERGTPKLVDFGLAFVTEEQRLTQTGAVLGTPTHMAPEQANAELGSVGVTTDVYGLGALLYHCLTGRPPFEETALLVLLSKVLSERPQPLRAHCPQAPAELEALVQRCLSKRPQDRPADVETFLAELESVGEGGGGQRATLALGGLLALSMVLIAAILGVRASQAAKPEAAPDPGGQQDVTDVGPDLVAAEAEGSDPVLLRAELRGEPHLKEALERAARTWASAGPEVRWAAARWSVSLIDGWTVGRPPAIPEALTEFWSVAWKDRCADPAAGAWELVAFDAALWRAVGAEARSLTPAAYRERLEVLGNASTPLTRDSEQLLDLGLAWLRNDTRLRRGADRRELDRIKSHLRLRTEGDEALDRLKDLIDHRPRSGAQRCLKFSLQFGSEEEEKLEALDPETRKRALALALDMVEDEDGIGPGYLERGWLVVLRLLRLQRTKDLPALARFAVRAVKGASTLSELTEAAWRQYYPKDVNSLSDLERRRVTFWERHHEERRVVLSERRKNAWNDLADRISYVQRGSVDLATALAKDESVTLADVERRFLEIYPQRSSLRWANRGYDGQLVEPGLLPYFRRRAVSFFLSHRRRHLGEQGDPATRVRAMVMGGRPRERDGALASFLEELTRSERPRVTAPCVRLLLGRGRGRQARQHLAKQLTRSARRDPAPPLDLVLATIALRRVLGDDRGDTELRTKAALESAPTDPVLATHLAALVLHDEGEGSPQEALPYLKRALAKHPTVIELRVLAAEAELMARDEPAALEHLAALFPDSAEEHRPTLARKLRRLWALREAKDAEQIRSLLLERDRVSGEERAACLDPQHPVVVAFNEFAGRELSQLFPANPYVWERQIALALEEGSKGRGRQFMDQFLRRCMDSAPYDHRLYRRVWSAGED